jgi:hypothetical protein
MTRTRPRSRGSQSSTRADSRGGAARRRCGERRPREGRRGCGWFASPHGSRDDRRDGERHPNPGNAQVAVRFANSPPHTHRLRPSRVLTTPSGHETGALRSTTDPELQASVASSAQRAGRERPPPLPPLPYPHDRRNAGAPHGAPLTWYGKFQPRWVRCPALWLPGRIVTVVELALSAERRGELVALLEDQQRLRAEYPKVAEYLEMAPMLSGTGDPQADAAFDLRLVHYLTGGEPTSGNPYWDIVGPSVSLQEGRRAVNGGRSVGSARLAFAQTILQALYAYAIPSPETIEWCSRFCDGRSVVELGAGRGYWAAQLALAGLIVHAYDSEPPGSTENVSFPRVAGQPDTWYRVGNLTDFSSRIAAGSSETLLLCWPPGWGDTMASDALASFEQAGGRNLVFIGEPRGGKTGDDAFFDALTAGWKLESQDEHHVSWWNLSDIAQAWVRR